MIGVGRVKTFKVTVVTDRLQYTVTLSPLVYVQSYPGLVLSYA